MEDLPPLFDGIRPEAIRHLVSRGSWRFGDMTGVEIDLARGLAKRMAFDQSVTSVNAPMVLNMALNELRTAGYPVPEKPGRQPRHRRSRRA